MEPKDATKQVFTANLMPSRGSWLELEIDKKGVVYARIDRKRKLPITTLLRALPAEDPTTGFQVDTSSNEAILKLFGDSHFIQKTLEKDATTRTEEEALIEVFKKQRPGEPPTPDNARNLLRSLFFDPKRYDLTKVGRYKLNQRLGVDVPDDTRVLTTQDTRVRRGRRGADPRRDRPAREAARQGDGSEEGRDHENTCTVWSTHSSRAPSSPATTRSMPKASRRRISSAHALWATAC